MYSGDGVSLLSLAARARAAASTTAEKAGDHASLEAGRAGAAGRGRVAQTGGVFAEPFGSAKEHHGGRLLLQNEEELSCRGAALSSRNEMGSGFLRSVSQARRIGGEAERSRGGARGVREVSGTGSGGEEFARDFEKD